MAFKANREAGMARCGMVNVVSPGWDGDKPHVEASLRRLGPVQPVNRTGWSVRTKAAIMLASQATSAIVAYGSLLIVGRFFEPASYGMFAFALGASGLLAFFTDIGVSLAYQRAVAGGAAPRTLFGVMLRLRLALTGMAGLVGLSLWWLAGVNLETRVSDATTWHVLAIVAFFQVFVLIRTTVESTWMAQQRIHLVEGLRLVDSVSVLFLLSNAGLLLAALNGWSPPFVAVGTLWADLLGLHEPLGLEGAAMLIAGSYAAAKLLGLGIALRWARRDELRLTAWDPMAARRLIRSALPLALALAVAGIVTSNDVVMLGYFWGAVEVAQYAAAQRLAGISLLAGGSVAALLFSRYAELHSQGDKAGTDSTFRAAQRFIVLIAAPLVAAMVALPQNGLLATVGPGYVASTTPVRWLAGWALFSTLSQPVVTRLMAEGHNRVLVIAVVLNAGSDVVLNLLFIPHWGPSGAAATTLVSAGIGYAYLRFWSKRAHGTPLWEPGVFRTLFAALLVGVIWWVAGQSLPTTWLDNAWELLVAGILGLMVYVGFLLLLKEVGPEDGRIVARLFHPGAWLPRKQTEE